MELLANSAHALFQIIVILNWVICGVGITKHSLYVSGNLFLGRFFVIIYYHVIIQ